MGQKSGDRAPVWIPQDRHDAYHYLTGTFSNLRSIPWADLECLIKATSPEKSFPQSVKSRLSEFQKLMILQAVRPDRLSIGLSSFICDNLNLTSITGLPFSFESIYREQSNNRNPILFLTTAGSDPSKELEEFGV